MTTDEKITNTTLMHYRLGIVLVWLGVMIWVPFVVLQLAGKEPSFFRYLPFHLIGVVGGARLRSSARKEMRVFPAKKGLLQTLGHGMIFSGILVWTPYFYLRVVQQSVEIMDYLPYHLTGILSGLALLVINYLISRKNNGKD